MHTTLTGIVADLAELINLQRYVQQDYARIVATAAHAGAYLSKMRGRGMGFAEARNYKAGDDIRHMEWRITARTGKPHVKVYHEERERPVVILTDFNPSMYFGTRYALKSVVAARLAAMLAWVANKNGDRVGGLMIAATKHDEFVPRAREQNLLPFIATLSQYTQNYHMYLNSSTKKRDVMEGRSFSHALLRLRRVAKPGSLLILISDFYTIDAESESQLARLREHNDLMFYQVCDPLELRAPKPNRYAITDGEQIACIDTRVSRQRAQYDSQCEQRISRMKQMCRRLNNQWIQIQAGQDVPMLVLQTFARKK